MEKSKIQNFQKLKFSISQHIGMFKEYEMDFDNKMICYVKTCGRDAKELRMSCGARQVMACWTHRISFATLSQLLRNSFAIIPQVVRNSFATPFPIYNISLKI